MQLSPPDPNQETDRQIRRRLCDAVIGDRNRWHTDSDDRRAKRYFFDSTGNIEADETEINAFLQWYVHDFRDGATRRTLMEHYFDTHDSQLAPRDREILVALRDSYPGVFEVESAEEGTGIALRDLGNGELIFVHDVTASRELIPGNCILSRIESLDGKLQFVSDGLSVPPAVRDEFLKLVDKDARAAKQTRAEYIRSYGNRLYRKISRLSDKWLKNLRIVNREGDTLEFGHADYRVLDEPALLAKLRTLQQLKEEPGKSDEAQFAWFETVAGDQTVPYGHVRVSQGRLRLEAQSRVRLQLGRGLLETHAAVLLHHEADSYVTLDDIKQRVAAREYAGPSDPVSPEAAREAILQFKAQLYATWPDDPLPVLGGKSARQTIATQAGRDTVLRLIRSMERDEARAAREGEPAFDFTQVRKALGLEND